MGKTKFTHDELNAKLKAIITRIRAEREYKNYSQDYMANKLDVSQNTYSKLELGYTTLTVERLLAISHILELDVLEVLNSSTESKTSQQPTATIHNTSMQFRSAEF